MAFHEVLLSSQNILGLGIPGIIAGLSLLLAATLTVRVVRRVYRVCWHPLKNFKGLPEAAVSEDWLYRTTKSGTAEQAFEALHRKYNTKALRIGPNELHITDIELYKVIYSQTKAFPKYPPFYDGFNTPHTVFAETDPRLHKERRRMLNPLFSKVGVYKFEPIMHEKVLLLASKINRLCESKEIDVYNAFRLLTTEVITQFAFAKSSNLIEEKKDDIDSWFLEAFDVGSQTVVETQYSAFLRMLVGILPPGLVNFFSPKFRTMFRLQKYAESCLGHCHAKLQPPSHPVVFDSLESVSDAGKVSEALDILIAGADTTASTLTTGLYHILTKPKIKARLIEEIDEALPKAGTLSSLQSLEKLEYLSACVKESIRMGMAVPGRLPRVVPTGDPFVVEGKRVPAGTVVGMSTYTMHTSVEAWGLDAREFNPDRWIGPAGKGLEQWQCTFSKGARMCLGQNVAPAEMTLAFAYIFRNYDMNLPKSHVPPKAFDRFTLQYLKPGLPVKFKVRV